jgi:subtilisin-like proprotein convertase family protein
VQPNILIPDVGTQVSSSIDISDTGTILDLRIQVNITHTYIGDLRIDLVAPDGASVVLHNNTGGSADNINRTYSPQDTASLRPLVGRQVQGRWHLRIRDTFRLDEGRLNRWRFAARIASPVPLTPATPPTRTTAASKSSRKSTTTAAS